MVQCVCLCLCLCLCLCVVYDHMCSHVCMCVQFLCAVEALPNQDCDVCVGSIHTVLPWTSMGDLLRCFQR